MEKRTLGFFASFFAVVAIVALAFNVATAPGNQPPLNVNVENTPLEVEVTNPSGLPIATDSLTAEVYESFWGSGPVGGDRIITHKYVCGLGGKTVVFTGGGVSGGIVFSSSEMGGGGAQGFGKVEVYNTELEWIEFALPLNSMLRIEDVEEIRVWTWACYPRLTGYVCYYATVVATVHWYIEE